MIALKMVGKENYYLWLLRTEYGHSSKYKIDQEKIIWCKVDTK